MPAHDLRETLEAILDHLRRLLEPTACAFQIVDWGSGEIRPEASWFASDAVQEAMSPILQRPYDPQRPGLTEAAIEQGRPLLLRDLGSWPGSEALQERLRDRLARDEAEVAWRWYQESAFLACPVTTAAGVTLGALAMSVPADRPLGEDDLRAVDVLAGLAALALERARHAHEELLLATASHEMGGSLEPEAVYRTIVEHAERLAGADRVMLSRFEAPTATLRVVASSGYSESVTSASFRAGEGMIGEVALTGVSYLSRREDEDRYLRWVVDREGVGSFAHVPILLGPRLFGVITVAHARPDAIDADTVRRVEALARLAAGAIANALAFHHERRIARALARGFVPAGVPSLAGFDIGLVYDPVDHVGGGGDFYGVWAIPDGGTAVLVGDVSGKGLEVSAISAMARFFVEARCVDSAQPARVLAEVDELLRRRSPEVQLITAFLGVVKDRRLCWCNAGHLPPLLVRAGAAVEELATGGIPLGVDGSVRWEQGETTIVPGDLIVAVTDGLVEARRHEQQFGEARLREHVLELAGEPAQRVAERLHEHVSDWATRVTDDVIVLAMRPR